MLNVVRCRLLSAQAQKTSLVRAQPALSDKRVQIAVENLRKNWEEAARKLSADPDKYVCDHMARREYAELSGENVRSKGTK